MRTKSLCLFTACVAVACCLIVFQTASEAADDSASVTLVSMEPVPDADDGLGSVSLSDYDSAAEARAGAPIDVPARNVSLKTMADEDLSVCDGTCDDGTCGDCVGSCSCRPCAKNWARADYLLWWTRGSEVPPLVTTSTDQTDSGILGQETTRVLYGDSQTVSTGRSAPRFMLGHWFDCCQTQGIQFDYFNLGQYNNNYHNYSDGDTLLARPFYSILDQQQAAELISSDVEIGETYYHMEGSVGVDADDYFQSFGVLGRWNVCSHAQCDCGTCGDGLCCGPDDCGGDACGCDACGGRNRGSLRYFFSRLKEPAGGLCYRVDFIAGYRNYRLDDNIRINESITLLDPLGGAPAGTQYDVEDSFRASNEFHGGELGIITQARRGCWTLELLAKMALGNNSCIANISGSTDIDRPGDEPAHYDAGILALQTNIGRYHHDRFIIIPQFGIELGYDLTCCLRAYCGYNFIYWAQVYRAAEQIDTNVNTSYIPPVDQPYGPAVPQFSFRDSDFWAQGLNLGLEWEF